MKVWAIIPWAVYGKPPAGIFSSAERAEEALALLYEASDKYHDLEIVAYELDAWDRDGTVLLKAHEAPPQEKYEEWRSLPPADGPDGDVGVKSVESVDLSGSTNKIRKAAEAWDKAKRDEWLAALPRPAWMDK